MKASISARLDNLQDRFEELIALLSDSDIIADQNRFRRLSREYAELEPVVECYREYRQVQDNLKDTRTMLLNPDPDLRVMIEEEVAAAQARIESLERELQILLLPGDPDDANNVFLEIRAGTGGDEAAIFAGDLFRMYSRYAESRCWKIEILSENPGEHGRLQGDHYPGCGTGCVCLAQVRVWRSPGSARTGNGVAGQDSYIGLHCCHHAGT